MVHCQKTHTFALSTNVSYPFRFPAQIYEINRHYSLTATLSLPSHNGDNKNNTSDGGCDNICMDDFKPITVKRPNDWWYEFPTAIAKPPESETSLGWLYKDMFEGGDINVHMHNIWLSD